MYMSVSILNYCCGLLMYRDGLVVYLAISLCLYAYVYLYVWMYRYYWPGLDWSDMLVYWSTLLIGLC